MARAFTLIELTVVLLVMSIVAAAVTLSVAGPKRLADADDAVAAAAQLDLLARRYAVRHGRAVQLVFDLDAGRLSWRPAARGDDGDEPPPGGACRMPEGYRLGRLVLPGKTIQAGQTAIWCSDRGATPSYAVRVDGFGESRWLLLAGMSGQASEIEDEKEIIETFALLAGGRHDLD